MSNHAVLCEHDGLVRIIGHEVLQVLPGVPRAVDLFGIMINFNLETLWVAPGHFSIPLLRREHFLQADDKWNLKPYDDDDQLSSLHAYKMAGRFGSPERQMRSIIWPEFTSWRWSPEEAPPVILLMALSAMETAFGVSMAGSPPIVGRKMFAQYLEASKKQEWMNLQPLGLLEKYPWGDAGKDAVWKYSFSKTEELAELHALLWHRDDYDPEAPIHLHAIDKNASFPNASQSLAVGIGEPVEWSAAAGEPAPAGKPGLWHIYAEPHIDTFFDGMSGPSPLYSSADGEYVQEWVTTPLLELLQKLKWKVQIYEGVYWPNSRRIFEDFAPSLWEKRQHFRRLTEIRAEDRDVLKHYQLAYNSSKRIMNSFFGMFASSKNRDKTFLRRDIWASVVEQAKAMMFYNIQKIEKESGLQPIAMITDCLIYASQESNPCRALGTIMSRDDKLGGYKLKWSLEASDAVLEALGELEVSEMMHQLNGLAEQKLALEADL